MKKSEKIQKSFLVKQQLICWPLEKLYDAYQSASQEIRDRFLLDIKELMDNEQGFFYMNAQIPKRLFTFFGMIRFDENSSNQEIINSIIFNYNQSFDRAIRNNIGQKYIIKEALSFGLRHPEECTFIELKHYIYASSIIFTGMLKRITLNYSADYEFLATVNYLLSKHEETFQECPYLLKDCLKIIKEVKRPIMEKRRVKEMLKNASTKNNS